MLARLSWFAYVVALGTWAILSYYSLAQYLQEGSMFARLFDGRPYVSDFINHYNASLLSKRAFSEHINIYDPAVQDASVRKLIAPIKPEAPFNLQYPPYFFVLVYPLSFFSLTGAWLLWNSVSLIGLFTSIRSICADIYSRAQQACIYIMVLASYPTWVGIELGQTAIPELVFVTGFFKALRARRFFVCGLIMSLITIKLQYTPYFGIVGLAAGGWPFLSGLACGLAILLAGSYFLLGKNNLLNFPAALLHGETGHHVSGVNAIEMQNLRGELTLIMHGEQFATQAAAVIFMSAVVILLLILWRRYAKQSSWQTDIHFKSLAGTTILLTLISSVHTHTQDYVMASLSCIWLYYISSLQISGLTAKYSNWRPRWIKRLAIIFPAYSWLLLFLKPLTQIIMIQPLFLWAVALSALSLMHLKDLWQNDAQQAGGWH